MEYTKIGRIANTHGLDGRLSLNHTLPAAAFRKLKHVFIELRNESYIPYFIEQAKEIDESTALVYFDDTDSVEEARKLTGKNIYIETSLIQQISPNSLPANLDGFMVHDKNIGVIGAVENIFETPGQVLATIIYKGKEVIIPLIDSTIQSIDGARKTISVNLPEGLLDVYLD
jgi:16S rRNA processing protein RimM